MPRKHALAETPWLTVDEAAARLRVGTRLVYREVAAGRLRAARVGGRRQLRLRADWCDEFLESCCTPVEISAH